MGKYSGKLPQLDGSLFLTDGGLETTLIFHEELDLPEFAAYPLLDTPDTRAVLDQYFHTYASLARDGKTGFILESATWRAGPDWANILGHDAAQLDRLNREAIHQLSKVRQAFETEHSPMVISGCVGPRGDGYVVGEAMTTRDAEAYHATQIGSFAKTDADMVTAITMTYAEEAIGIANAAEAAGLPAAISFTVETDGHLPSGQPLKEAIAQVDSDARRAPAYFMINCAHPTHFAGPVNNSGDWLGRIQGIRANASKMSHAEPDEAEELDDGNPIELGSEYRELIALLPNLNIMGGCCGTDHRHVHAIFEACS